MRRMVLAALAVCLAAGGARAQDGQEDVPAACRPKASGAMDLQACADAAEPGSFMRGLALINLGSQAFQRQDYAAAVRFYDEARPPSGQTMFSDPTFHAFRGAAYFHVGRDEEALADARLAVAMLTDETTPPVARGRFSHTDVDQESVYLAVLPILHRARAPELADALRAYRDLPARDWMSLANRAAIFQQMGDNEGAAAASEQALQMAPDHPAVLNNHCYILTLSGRARDALPFCERAVDSAPNIAAARHSYAAALAGVGECNASARELATAQRLDPVARTYRQPIACEAR